MAAPRAGAASTEVLSFVGSLVAHDQSRLIRRPRSGPPRHRIPARLRPRMRSNDVDASRSCNAFVSRVVQRFQSHCQSAENLFRCTFRSPLPLVSTLWVAPGGSSSESSSASWLFSRTTLEQFFFSRSAGLRLVVN